MEKNNKQTVSVFFSETQYIQARCWTQAKIFKVVNQLEFCLSTEHETVPVCEQFCQACISSISISSVGINLKKSFFITKVIRTEKKFCKCFPLCSHTWIKTPVVMKSTPGVQKYFLMN